MNTTTSAPKLGAQHWGTEDYQQMCARKRIDHPLALAAPELLMAVWECERRLERIACGEVSGVAAKATAKSGLETIRIALAKAEGAR